MHTDPPAPDPGAIRTRLPAIRNTLNYTLSDKRRLAAVREDHLAETLDLADALLAAYDAQAQELAAHKVAHDANMLALDAQAARLAAVEQALQKVAAARAYSDALYESRALGADNLAEAKRLWDDANAAVAGAAGAGG